MKNEVTEQVSLNAYLRLFEPYREQLKQFDGREREYGGRFSLLFRQVLRMLVRPAELNQQIPKLFVTVAHKYFDGDKETIRHFSYEDNRHFFLSDLYDWLQIRERGRKMQVIGR
ncbi:MAG: hypothetical protein ABW116_16490 [Candidatus Sedimenticola sp. 20ELBAFRAG]